MTDPNNKFQYKHLRASVLETTRREDEVAIITDRIAPVEFSAAVVLGKTRSSRHCQPKTSPPKKFKRFSKHEKMKYHFVFGLDLPPHTFTWSVKAYLVAPPADGRHHISACGVPLNVCSHKVLSLSHYSHIRGVNKFQHSIHAINKTTH